MKTTGKHSRTFSIVILVVVVLCCSCGMCAHTHRSNSGSDQDQEQRMHTKEREVDGAFSPQSNNYERISEFDHEAILGSKASAEEFDHLSPEESKRRLKLLATDMDRNKDGHIDREELTLWILQSFKMLNKEDSMDRHEESDSDNDGYVTWDEYIDENYGVNPFEDVKSENEDLTQDQKMMLEDKQLFAASDLDGDGRLSTNEFLVFSHPEEFNYTSEILLQRTMEDKDHNRDGFLNLDEYLGEDAKGKDKQWYIAEKDKFDNDYDLDHDGKLSSDEVKLWLTPDDEDSAEQESDHLFDVSDDNLDDVLSIEEIVSHYETFVGSEATDYGQHLQDPSKFRDEL